MSLSLYNQKRNFSETSEPKGKEKSSKDSLRFVIQKHDASSLHYDFRLELESVLKSWAVPKGPSMNTADKRLAMMVEDHPYDYRNFEGVIPEGNYGAGTVIVWDEGTYEPVGEEGLSKKEKEKKLLKNLEAGNLDIELKGQKIRGKFRLFRLKNDAEGKSWLLVKRTDDYASADDITKENKSVKSGKTLTQVAAENGATLNHPDESKSQKIKSVKAPAKEVKSTAAKETKAPAKKTSKKKALDIKALLGDSFSKVKEAIIPKDIKPMLATLVDTPFSDPAWIYEIKWDGYRAVAYLEDGQAELISRNNKSFSEKYKEVATALEGLSFDAVFDGEIVALNKEGLAEFQLLQNWQNAPNGKLQFFIFDIIWLNGYDITALPLVERKRILKELLPSEDAVLKYSDHVVEKGEEFFKVALKQGLEGIMAKKGTSPYVIGSREDTWLKVKVNKRQEVIIVGYTAPRKTRTFFGALLLGVYKDDELIYVGHTGSGFNKKSLEGIWNKLQPLVVKECPFAKCPKGNMPVTWVAPKLVCEIKFTEWTNEFIARHPIFMGLREDKKPKDVVIEKSKTLATMTKKAMTTPAKKEAPKKAASKNSSTVKEPKEAPKKSSSKLKTSGIQVSINDGKDQTITLDNQELKLTNLDKIYWPKDKKVKLDLVNYYLQAAPFILPYMMDRPQSLN
ncbi:MAG TPA: non-homologous end-joining DNA ligase, partial [Chitinophagaceae bacterium]|nr:non-homologous end-joining DNA ligase [Chitinophagaceae bacterium]